MPSRVCSDHFWDSILITSRTWCSCKTKLIDLQLQTREDRGSEAGKNVFTNIPQSLVERYLPARVITVTMYFRRITIAWRLCVGDRIEGPEFTVHPSMHRTWFPGSRKAFPSKSRGHLLPHYLYLILRIRLGSIQNSAAN